MTFTDETDSSRQGNTGPACLIFAAGHYYGEPSYPRSQDSQGRDRPAYVIAADGGADRAIEYGFQPDLVVGDFDSISHVPQTDEQHIQLPEHKDDTDLVSALKLGWSRGFRRFHIYGGLGGRVDHSIANIASLCLLAQSGGQGLLYGDATIVTALSQASLSFPAWQAPRNARTVSVFSASDYSYEVTEHGLKYSLDHATVDRAMSSGSGISNEFLTDTPAQISLAEGTLIVTYPMMSPTPSWHTSVPELQSLGKLTYRPSAHLSQADR